MSPAAGPNLQHGSIVHSDRVTRVSMSVEQTITEKTSSTDANACDGATYNTEVVPEEPPLSKHTVHFDTMPSLNSNLMSGPKMFEMGYDTNLTHDDTGGPQARKPLQRLPLQDMNRSRIWPMGSASWPRYTPRNILISRSSREIRACATTRRALARQPPDRPSRGEIFARVRNHSAGRGSVDFACTPLLPYM